MRIASCFDPASTFHRFEATWGRVVGSVPSFYQDRKKDAHLCYPPDDQVSNLRRETRPERPNAHKLVDPLDATSDTRDNVLPCDVCSVTSSGDNRQSVPCIPVNPRRGARPSTSLLSLILFLLRPQSQRAREKGKREREHKNPPHECRTARDDRPRARKVARPLAERVRVLLDSHARKLVLNVEVIGIHIDVLGGVVLGGASPPGRLGRAGGRGGGGLLENVEVGEQGGGNLEHGGRGALLCVLRSCPVLEEKPRLVDTR